MAHCNTFIRNMLMVIGKEPTDKYCRESVLRMLCEPYA